MQVVSHRYVLDGNAGIGPLGLPGGGQARTEAGGPSSCFYGTTSPSSNRTIGNRGRPGGRSGGALRKSSTG